MGINPYGISHEFAENVAPITVGSTIDDFDQHLQIQLAYQKGMYKMLKLMSSK